MISAWSEPFQGLPVLGCTIATIAGPVIAGTAFVQVFHQAVARDLGQDRGGGNGEAEAVGPGQGPVRTGQGGGVKAVHQGGVRNDLQLGHGSFHGKQAGLQDIDLVDFLDAGLTDAAATAVADGLAEGNTALRGQLLGVVEVFERRALCGVRGDANGCRDDRPGPWTSSGLVEPDDYPIVAGTEFYLETVVRHADRRGRAVLSWRQAAMP